MKTRMKHLALMVLAAAAFCGGTAQMNAQVSVKVDSTLPWAGFVNVWQTDGTSYVFGSAWGTADLRAAFIPTNSPSGWPLNNGLVLQANTGTYNTNDVFWNNPDGTCNKVLEANFYRDVGTAFAGQTVTFTGTVVSNNLPAPSGGAVTGWECVAFIKEFTSTYGFVGITTVPLTPGSFTVSMPIGAGHVAQYGFYVKGPNVAPNSADALRSVGILVEDADPAITSQPKDVTMTTGNTTNLSVTAIGSSTLSYQWATNGVPLLNGAKYSGVSTPTLTIANAQVADSGSYVVTVSDTAGSVDSRAAVVNVLDILITNNPVSQRVEQNSTVVFSVGATSPSALSYQWSSVIGGVTNALTDGATVSGATSSALTLSNVQVAASGTYFVTISTGSGSASTGASLVVKSFTDFSNFLENPGFETGTDNPWVRFSSSDPSFGHLQTTADTYFGGGNVNVYEGTYVSYTTFNGDYSGIYQDVPTQPGQIFAADFWVYNASGDPIPGPSMNASNEIYLEIQFRAGDAGTPLQQFVSPILNYTTPLNTWLDLQATNAGTYGSLPPGVNGRYLIAPPGTTKVRFQLTMHDLGGSVGAGSLYYDSAKLMLKIPATLGASMTGTDAALSWKSQGATSYQVQYKDTLDGAWQNLEVVPGTGSVITKSYPATGNQRFYRVLTL